MRKVWSDPIISAVLVRSGIFTTNKKTEKNCDQNQTIKVGLILEHFLKLAHRPKFTGRAIPI